MVVCRRFDVAIRTTARLITVIEGGLAPFSHQFETQILLALASTRCYT
jgi:hypothetical protein